MFKHDSGLWLSAMKFDANCKCIEVQQWNQREVHICNRWCTVSEQNIGSLAEIPAIVERAMRLLQWTLPQNNLAFSDFVVFWFFLDNYDSRKTFVEMHQYTEPLFQQIFVPHFGMTIDAFASRNLQHVLWVIERCFALGFLVVKSYQRNFGFSCRKNSLCELINEFTPTNSTNKGVLAMLKTWSAPGFSVIQCRLLYLQNSISKTHTLFALSTFCLKKQLRFFMFEEGNHVSNHRTVKCGTVFPIFACSKFDFFKKKCFSKTKKFSTLSAAFERNETKHLLFASK